MNIDIARRVRVPMSDAEVRRIVSAVLESGRRKTRNSKLETRNKSKIRNLKFEHSGLFRISDFGFRISPTLSVAFVSPRAMRRLNRTYHGEDRVTDVLAFPAGEREEARNSKLETRSKSKIQNSKFEHSGLFRISDFGFRISRPQPSKVQLFEPGELVICPAYVKRQAARAGEPFRRELTRVLIHGTLHLLGYDHARPRDAERMFGMQEGIMRKLF